MFLLSNSACWCAPVAVASRLFSSLDAPRTHHDPANVATGLGSSQIHPFDSICFKTVTPSQSSFRQTKAWPKFFEGPWPGGTVGSCFWRSKCFLQQNVWERSCVSILALLNLVTRRWQLDKTLGHWVKCKEPAFSGLLWNRQQTAPSQPAQLSGKNTTVYHGVSKVKDSEVGYGLAHTARTVSFQILLQSLLRNTN